MCSRRRMAVRCSRKRMAGRCSRRRSSGCSRQGWRSHWWRHDHGRARVLRILGRRHQRGRSGGPGAVGRHGGPAELRALGVPRHACDGGQVDGAAGVARLADLRGRGRRRRRGDGGGGWGDGSVGYGTLRDGLGGGEDGGEVREGGESGCDAAAGDDVAGWKDDGAELNMRGFGDGSICRGRRL